MMMGPLAISGGTLVWFNVSPLVAGKVTPATRVVVRRDTAVAGPSLTGGILFFILFGDMDPGPDAGTVPVMVGGRATPFRSQWVGTRGDNGVVVTTSDFGVYPDVWGAVFLFVVVALGYRAGYWYTS